MEKFGPDQDAVILAADIFSTQRMIPNNPSDPLTFSPAPPSLPSPHIKSVLNKGHIMVDNPEIK